MNTIIEKIRSQLKKHADEKTKKSGKNFFKEDIQLYGVKTATVTKIGKDGFKGIENKEKSHVFALCEELWKSGIMEESFIACQWSYAMRKFFEPKDFSVFERWVRTYVTNWASCDTFCNHTIGSFVDMYPEYVKNLKMWTTSKNRWVRRASAVSFIVPAKNGKFLKDVFEIADLLLKDSDDLVQKGYGWMLKVASQAHQKQVFDFIMKRKTSMPRTALRYAIEKMPDHLKKQAMAKT